MSKRKAKHARPARARGNRKIHRAKKRPAPKKPARETPKAGPKTVRKPKSKPKRRKLAPEAKSWWGETPKLASIPHATRRELRTLPERCPAVSRHDARCTRSKGHKGTHAYARGAKEDKRARYEHAGRKAAVTRKRNLEVRYFRHEHGPRPVYAPSSVLAKMPPAVRARVERNSSNRHHVLREAIKNRDPVWTEFHDLATEYGWDYTEIADEWFSPEM